MINSSLIFVREFLYFQFNLGREIQVIKQMDRIVR